MNQTVEILDITVRNNMFIANCRLKKLLSKTVKVF